jgi:hypothetical protein
MGFLGTWLGYGTRILESGTWYLIPEHVPFPCNGDGKLDNERPLPTKNNTQAFSRLLQPPSFRSCFRLGRLLFCSIIPSHLPFTGPFPFVT